MKKETTINIKYWVIVLLISPISCEDFLDTQPYGTTTLQTLSQQTKGAEALLIAAYSNLDGNSIGKYPWAGAASNWIFGSIAGGDAYKGAFDLDQYPITDIEIHSRLTPGNFYLEGKWTTYYNGVARANDAIKAFQSIEGMKEEFRTTRIAEARFLRGLYHFELYKIFRKVPFIDETITDVRIGNGVDILPRIQEDFLFASAHLRYEKDPTALGRIVKGTAQAYFGISKMWEYEQGYEMAKIYFDSVMNSGQYHLNATYHENFTAEKRSYPESILEVQQSVNDGAFGGNGNPGDDLNYPHGNAPVGCCGFHQPSQNLVNAFKTDSDGLPLLYTYNDSDVTSDDGIKSTQDFTPYPGTLDPRLDWTVGRRGLPYLDWGVHPGHSPGWIRDPQFGGPYVSMKTIFHRSQAAGYSQSGWANDNANNLKLLRYADLLLYTAEVEVELGNLSVAEELVNQVRDRAANPAGWVYTYVDPSNPSSGFTDEPAANYFIKIYPAGHFVAKGKEYARDAVRFERRIELGMEGHRFFDLVRWGIAAKVRNDYFSVEKNKRTYLKDGNFIEGKHEVFPIPKNAIDLSYKNGVPTLEQNKGY